jgi:hypothetical protein
MTGASCPCCNLARPVAALLRRRPLRWDDAWRPDLTRAPIDRMAEVAARIEHVLDGRCTVRVVESAAITRTWFDAAG